jgi:glycosyltransferase involved in cell wall biosynthesis
MNDTTPIRVAHIVDSLSAGGAEQMAVNFTNGLNRKGVPVWLIATRKGGILEGKVNEGVGLVKLEKKNAADIITFLQLLATVRRNDINIVHAHSSSVVWATLLKLFRPKLKVVWHDHYGNSEMLAQRPKAVLKMLAPFWSFVYSVNGKLQDWAVAQLGVPKQNTLFLNNFAALTDTGLAVPEMEKMEFKGVTNFVCVANLRPQKDHANLLRAFALYKEGGGCGILHLIGVNPGDAYATGLLSDIGKHAYAGSILYHGAQSNTGPWLKYMQVGILPSISEGLPVSLLEYGLAGLTVVATAVGQIAEVLQDGKFGYLVPAGDSLALAQAMTNAESECVGGHDVRKFKGHVEKNYSEDAALAEIMSRYRNCLVGH